VMPDPLTHCSLSSAAAALTKQKAAMPIDAPQVQFWMYSAIRMNIPVA
jgi:hypothetical protein